MRNLIYTIYSVFLCAALVFGWSLPLCAQEVHDGLVSWYGPGFHSKRTASGEGYDMYGLTCAHRTWKFGTLVEVYNKESRRKCVVRVNDRGPVAKTLLMDLSYGAAMAITSHELGTASVRLTVVGDSSGPFDKEQVFYLFLDDTIVLPEQIDLKDLPEHDEAYYKNIAGGVEIFRLTQKHIRRLYQAKVDNAPELLVSIDRHICLGPFVTFKEAEAMYHKVATQYPHASVWLEKESSVRRLTAQ